MDPTDLVGFLGRSPSQDCQGGCFDSAGGAVGKVEVVDDQQYGPQDFFGLMDEMRVWKVVRTEEQIQQGMVVGE